MEVTIVGELASLTEERWQAYTRRDGTQAEAGVRRQVWLVQEDSAPVALEVHDVELWRALHGVARFSTLACSAEPVARQVGGRAVQSFRLVSVVTDEAA